MRPVTATSQPALQRPATLPHPRSRGVAIVTVLIFTAVLMALLASYVTMTLTESRTLKASSNSTQGFFSAKRA